MHGYLVVVDGLLEKTPHRFCTDYASASRIAFNLPPVMWTSWAEQQTVCGVEIWHFANGVPHRIETVNVPAIPMMEEECPVY